MGEVDGDAARDTSTRQVELEVDEEKEEEDDERVAGWIQDSDHPYRPTRISVDRRRMSDVASSQASDHDLMKSLHLMSSTFEAPSQDWDKCSKLFGATFLIVLLWLGVLGIIRGVQG